MNHDGHFRNSKQAAITDLAKSNLLILIRSSTSYKAIWKKGQKPFFINPKAYPAVIRFDLDDDDDHGSTVLLSLSLPCFGWNSTRNDFVQNYHSREYFWEKFAGCQRPLSPIMHHASITISPIKSSCLRFLEKKSVCKFWMLVRVCNIIKHLPLTKQPLYFRETGQGWQKSLQVNWLCVSKNLVRWLGVRSVFFGTTLKPPSPAFEPGKGCK